MKGNFTIFFTALFPSLGGTGSTGWVLNHYFLDEQMHTCWTCTHTHTLTQQRTMQPVSHAGKTHASHRTEYAMQKEPESLSRMMMSNNVQVERRHLCLLPSTTFHSTVCVLSCLAMFDSLWSQGLKSAGSSVHGMFQARILEWGIFPDPGIKLPSPVSPALQVDFFTHWAIGEALSQH